MAGSSDFFAQLSSASVSTCCLTDLPRAANRDPRPFLVDYDDTENLLFIRPRKLFRDSVRKFLEQEAFPRQWEKDRYVDRGALGNKASA